MVHADGSFSVPTVYLSLSSLYCYPLLHAWVTCPSVFNIMVNLIPGGSNFTEEISRAPTSRHACLSLANSLAAGCTAGQLMDRLNMLHGLRENVISLGMADDALWRVMSLTNQLLCSALKLQQSARADLVASS